MTFHDQGGTLTKAHTCTLRVHTEHISGGFHDFPEPFVVCFPWLSTTLYGV